MKPLKEFNTWLEPILLSIAENIAFSSQPPLETVLKHPRLILALNHSTPLSWLPAISLLSREFTKAGGESRIPKGIVDRWFFANPFTKGVAEYLTQKSQPDDFESLTSGFLNNEFTDLIVLPEGANTFFGDPNEIREFRSTKFIEIAQKAKVPILICSHSGSENWSVPLEIPQHIAKSFEAFSRFFSPKLQQGQSLNFPLPINKISHFRMNCFLYEEHLNETIAIEKIANDIKNKMHSLKTAL